MVGTAKVATSAEEAIAKIQGGDILITKNTDKDYTPAIEKASGIVVEAGGLSSHAAVVGLSLGIPVIVGAKNITNLVADGQTITLDPKGGIVYKGKIENV